MEDVQKNIQQEGIWYLVRIDKSFIKDDLDRDKLLIYEKGLVPILADKYYFFQNDEWIKILENK